MIKYPKLNTPKSKYFCHWDILIFVIVSYFLLRISNFLIEEKQGARIRTKYPLWFGPAFTMTAPRERMPWPF